MTKIRADQLEPGMRVQTRRWGWREVKTVKHIQRGVVLQLGGGLGGLVDAGTLFEV